MTDEKKKRIEELKRELEEERKLMEESIHLLANPPRSQAMAELVKLTMEEETDEEKEKT